MFVSIVMPALNEESFIEKAIDSVLPRSPGILFEILVMDGGSTDRTREIVEERGRADPRIRLIANPKRIQAAAVNLAAGMADPRATVLLRADCHAVYPEAFVETCCRKLAETQAVSIVVPMITAGHRCFQKAVAAVSNSPLGNGGAPHRNLGAPRFVDHGHHAAFDRRFFLSIGGYDETFTHNEDAELDLRIMKMGGKIWLETSAAITYFPRGSIRRLARQYFSYGRGRARTVTKHRIRPGIRQLLPLIATGGSALCLLLALGSPIFLVPPLAYALLCCGYGALEAWRQRDRCLLAMGPAALTIHFSWSIGFLAGLMRRFQGYGRGSMRNLADRA